MNRKNLLEPEVISEVVRRIGAITHETQPEWGSMNAAQMMAHCAEVQEVANGKTLRQTPMVIRLARGLIKRAVLSENPYPKNVRTHPQYVVADGVSFDEQRSRLLGALRDMQHLVGDGVDHPLFGHLSPEEAGWAMYKHLDHHLTQFGA